MKKEQIVAFAYGIILACVLPLAAQTPTIFSSIRVNGTSDLRGNVSSGVGSLLLSDDVSVSGKMTTAATTVGAAGINLPHGTAPGVPVNGDLWTTTSGLFGRINGVTVGPYAAGTSFPLLAPDGTDLAPSYSFTNDPDSGLYRVGIDNLALAVNGGLGAGLNLSGNDASLSGSSTVSLDTGTETLTVGGGVIEAIGATFLSNGGVFHSTNLGLVSSATYGWDGDNDTGLYSPAVDQAAITAGGVQRALFNSSGTTVTDLTVTGTCTGCGGGVAGADTQVQFNNAGAFGGDAGFTYDAAGDDLTVADRVLVGLGLVGAPTLAFSGDSDTGLYRPAANQIGIVTGGGSRMTLSSTSVSIANTSALNIDPATTISNTLTVSIGGGELSVSSGSVIMDPGLGADELAVTSGLITATAPITTDNTTSNEIGYKGIPQNIQAGNYGIVLTDAATHIYHASGAGAGDTYTIPANGSVAFPIGSVLTFVNDDSNSVALAITTDAMTLAGTTSTAPCTLTENSMATALKVTSTSWLINGTGITCP